MTRPCGSPCADHGRCLSTLNTCHEIAATPLALWRKNVLKLVFKYMLIMNTYFELHLESKRPHTHPFRERTIDLSTLSPRCHARDVRPWRLSSSCQRTIERGDLTLIWLRRQSLCAFLRPRHSNLPNVWKLSWNSRGHDCLPQLVRDQLIGNINGTIANNLSQDNLGHSSDLNSMGSTAVTQNHVAINNATELTGVALHDYFDNAGTMTGDMATSNGSDGFTLTSGIGSGGQFNGNTSTTYVRNVPSQRFFSRSRRALTRPITIVVPITRCGLRNTVSAELSATLRKVICCEECIFYCMILSSFLIMSALGVLFRILTHTPSSAFDFSVGE